MRISARFAWSSLAGLVLLFTAAVALAQSAPPQRPFSQLIDLWTLQLDRIAARTDLPSLLPTEIDTLREQASDVRAEAIAAAAFARNDLADTKKLLAPLEIKSGPDAPPESDAVKAERQRMTEQATASEGRVKQGEVVIARADQLLERLTKRRSEVVLQTLLHRDAPPLSREVLTRLGPELAASVRSLSSALAAWSGNGIVALGSDGHSLVLLTIWAAVTIGLWWIGRELRRRFGHSHAHEPGHSDHTIAVAIDGLGLVLVPILAVWLIGKLLLASVPPPPIDSLVPELVSRVVMLLLVLGMTSAALSPSRPEWRVLPFTDDSARRLSYSIRRLMIIGLTLDFIYVAFVRSGVGREAVAAVSALLLATIVALLTPAGAGQPRLAGRPARGLQPSENGGRHLVVDRAPAAQPGGAVLDRICPCRLRHFGVASQWRTFRNLSADRHRAASPPAGIRSARDRRRTPDTIGTLGASSSLAAA